MDGLPSYQRPAPVGWLRMLFLTTGFVIGGMCLWAFVQKKSAQRSAPIAAISHSPHAADQADATRVLQVADDPQLQPWQTESPAHLAIQSAKPSPVEAEESIDSPAWYLEQDLAARQASFERAESQSVRVSKPPLDEAAAFLTPLAATVEEPGSLSEAPPVDRESLPVAEQLPGAEQSRGAVATEDRQAVSIAPRAESIIAGANDSFWHIAQRVYGDPRYYTALYEHNRNWIAYPDQIEQGFQVMTPPVEYLREHYPHLCPESR